VTTEHWTERLSDYLDEELTPADRGACEAHLAGCEQCRDVLEELRAVVQFARADADVLPTADLWSGIRSRLATGPSIVARGPRQFVFTLPQLALAASLLIAVSAGVAYVAAGRAWTSPVPQEDPIQAQAEPLLPPSAGVEHANFADAQFDEAVADLEKVLTDRREQLDPRTVLIIERNLAAIDQAIREARAALDADPANTFLNSHLADARRKKLDLLRQATMLQSPSGD
jgi:hypothetical protein